MSTDPLPAIFIGHGSPMNALEDNAYTRAWRRLGAALPRPRAILCISAHWFVPGGRVTAMSRPRTIHDFGGFPPALHRVSYPAPGDVALAARIQALLAPTNISLDQAWGLDHGTWSVLSHVFPEADVPVVQLGLDETEPPEVHYALGKRLLPLREEGVLVVGSGNVVHNLHAYSWGRRSVEPFDWAVRFEQRVRLAIQAGDHRPIVSYPTLGEDALLSVPTPEHYLPLLYVLALARPGEPVTFPVEGMDGGSVSMLAVQVG
jgi:4,5-DOPA dioxygenase extradiol